MIFKEFGIFSDDFNNFVPFFLGDNQRTSFFEIIVFFCSLRIIVCSLPAIPRPLYIISLHNFLSRVEHIGHDYEIAPACLLSLIVSFDQFMETKKFSNQGIRILLNVIVIVLEDISQELVLSIVDGLEGILAVSSVVEERTTFTLTRQRSH